MYGYEEFIRQFLEIMVKLANNSVIDRFMTLYHKAFRPWTVVAL